MTHQTRQFLLIVLCIISALPMCLSAFFLGGRILIRKAMVEQLDTGQTVTLHLPANNLHWYEQDHELLIDGRMFDVKSIRDIEGGYEVTGLFDDDETELFEQLVKTETGKRDGRGPLTGLFQTCLGLIAESPVSAAFPKPLVFAFYREFPQTTEDQLWETALEQQGPPPKTFLS